MEELIKFRQFADKMSQDEFESIMPKITQILGKEELISLLFNHFQDNINNFNNETTRAKLTKINQQISNNTCIISLGELPQIDKIPEAVINNIASYLDIRSYSQFERCNRTIFIAARSPYQPYTDKFRWSIIHYVRYCTKNNIKIKKNKFSRMQYLRYPLFAECIRHLSFDKLRELKIDFTSIDDFNAYQSSYSTNINLTSLRTLSIKGCQLLPADEFNALLPQATNLQILKLDYIQTPIIHSINHEIFKQLKGLSLTTGNSNWSLVPENVILDLCSSELISFYTDSDLTRLNMNCKRFPNLQELHLANNSNEKIIEQIIEFKYLKKIHLEFIDYWMDNSSESLISLTPTFINALFSLCELEVVEFDVSGNGLPKLMKLIQNALMIHKKKK
eukprot:126908_1